MTYSSVTSHQALFLFCVVPSMTFKCCISSNFVFILCCTFCDSLICHISSNFVFILCCVFLIGINFDKYHPGYFGKVGMRHFHLMHNAQWCPIINVNKLWMLVPKEEKKDLNPSAASYQTLFLFCIVSFLSVSTSISSILVTLVKLVCDTST